MLETIAYMHALVERAPDAPDAIPSNSNQIRSFDYLNTSVV
ncbi:hypothetical protein [Burkholderia diffusa]|nr:hypothetical protein [Burkholderia diffusa]